MGRHTIGLFITNPIDRSLLSDFLRQLGHEVYASAFATREPERHPDSSLIVADEEAARFYGQSLLELKWRVGVDFLPLLIVLPQKVNSASWLQAGFDDVLRQPLTKDELKARLEVFLRFRRHSEQYRLIFENALVGIYRSAPDGRLLMANPALVRMLGFSSFEELSRETLKEQSVRTEPSRAVMAELLAREGQVTGLESSWTRRDGAILFALESARVVRDEAGRALYFEGSVEDITDRRRADQSLRESEARYQAIIAALAEGIIFQDADGVLRSANQSAERILGLTLDQMSGRTSQDPRWRAVHEDGSPFPGEEHPPMIALRTGESQSNVIMGVHRPDDTLVWLSINAQPLLDDAGKPAGVVSSFFDITAQKQAEASLREAAERLRFMAESMPQKIFTATPSGDVDYFNRQWMEFTGLTFDEIKNWGWTQFIHPDDVEENVRLWRHSINTGDPFQFEHRFRRADGIYRWHLSRAHAMRDAEGNVAMWIGSNTEIDDVKRTEAALREQTEVVETINRIGQTLSAELDLQKVVQAVTDAATEVTGAHFGSFFYNVLDEAGGPYMLYTLSGVPREAFSHFPMPRATDLFGPTFRGGGIVRIADVKLDPRYGKNSPYYGMPAGHLPVTSYLAVPVISRSGEVVGGLFFGHPQPGVFSERDERVVTGLAAQAAVAMDNARLFELVERERAKAESAAQENARLYEEAERANRLKDEFLATVSHELRTPLTAIIGWSAILRSNKLDARASADALETIERNAKAQSQLIEDLMDVSRIITGKLRLDVQTVNLASVVESAIASLKPAAEARSIRLQPVLDPRAGPVSGDPTRLQQVAWNLLSNAIKFTPKGGRVEVRLERIDSHVELTVSDTGIGIKPEFLPFVFDRFRQADGTTTRAYGGLGLGLAIVRHLVELHGGTARVDSRGEGQGTTFSLMLPLRAISRELGREERRHPTAESAPPLECPPELDGLRVLVVDDEPDTRLMLKVMLEQCGAEVTTAASARKALEVIERVRPDVLVSDIGMPEEDGYALMRKVRALPAGRGGRLPAAALTAYAGAEDRKRALRAGFQVHIPKPVDPAELVAAVASLAGRTGKA
jgi:PAS domain S-box-containing protein